MDKNIDLILKQTLNKLRNKSRVKGKCLTEEDITCLIDTHVSESARNTLLEHVLSCSRCAVSLREHLLVLNAIDKKGTLETPEAVVQAAMGLFNPEVGPNILEIALNFKEKVIELIRTTGNILRGSQLVPIPVLRSQKEDNTFINEIKIVKEFNNVLTEVGVEKRKPELCDIEVRLTEKDTKSKIQDLRITLNKDDREIESCLVESGKVVFKDVRPGRYTITITKENQKLGIVGLLITAS